MKYNFIPTAGLRNHQFEGIEDICDMKAVMIKAKEARRKEREQ